MKTKIFNLIILDESGSMAGVKTQTISGCNETLNTIRSAQTRFAETQEHYVSIYAFQENDQVPSRYLIKNAPIIEVSNINSEQYKPWGCTPLYDAVGATLADLKATTSIEEIAIGSVTIITDGLENASSLYTHEQVAKMISALKELGWSFNFIGANIDVRRTATSLNIDNSLSFRSDAKGTTEMFRKERNSRMSYYERADYNIMAAQEDGNVDKKGILSSLKQAAKNYFSNDDDEPVL